MTVENECAALGMICRVGSHGKREGGADVRHLSARDCGEHQTVAGGVVGRPGAVDCGVLEQQLAGASGIPVAGL